jgi:hypothetical protein
MHLAARANPQGEGHRVVRMGGDDPMALVPRGKLGLPTAGSSQPGPRAGCRSAEHAGPWCRVLPDPALQGNVAALGVAKGNVTQGNAGALVVA